MANRKTSSPKQSGHTRRRNTITAYPLDGHEARLTGRLIDEIAPGAARRQWMDDTPHRFAYRCIPMTMANSMGWMLLNPVRCQIIWDGTTSPEGIKVTFPDGVPARNPVSHFGSGVVTWNPPLLFRTPPGIGMIVTGPANAPKRGITPLEGFVETDWLPNGFSMNWKVTEPNFPIVFEAGEPFCRIYPYQKDFLEHFSVELRDSREDPEFRAQVMKWTHDRAIGMKRARENGSERGYWSGNYAKGRDAFGNVREDHKNVFRCSPPVDKTRS